MSDMVTVCIGNSDDKLTQQQWSNFVADVNTLILRSGFQLHFHGFPSGAMPWQNACWVFELPNHLNIIIIMQELQRELAQLCVKYDQDSIAVILGDSMLVTPKG
jgi:hypothetical protein